MTKLCQVCNKNEPVGVASSALGPMSIAYCQRCLNEGYEPMGAIIGCLMGHHNLDCFVDEVSMMIRRSIEFHGISEEKLWVDVAWMDAEYDAYCERESTLEDTMNIPRDWEGLWGPYDPARYKKDGGDTPPADPKPKFPRRNG